MKKALSTVGCLALCIGLLTWAGGSWGQDQKTPKSSPKGTPKKGVKLEFPNSPEGAYQNFMYAGFTRNEDLLREVSLPAEDLEILLEGEKPPAAEFAKIKKEIMKIEFHRLEAGQSVDLPTGQKLEVKPEDVDKTHVLIMAVMDPIPTKCELVEGQWKIDARPVVAARKTADESLKKAGTKKKAAPKTKKKKAESLN